MSTASPKRPLSVQLPDAAGLWQLATIGTWSMITGFAILSLAVPTICILPHEMYIVHHFSNLIVSLYLVFTGYLCRAAVLCKLRYRCLCGSIYRPPLSLAATFGAVSLFVILFSWGAFLRRGEEDGGNIGMILQQVRSASWGDLNPTENQIWALHILSILITFLHGIGGLLSFFGAVIAITYWIFFVNEPRLRKEIPGNEKADEMILKLDVEHGEFDKKDVAFNVVLFSDGQSGQYV